MQQEELTKTIIGCAMRVHRALGAGFLESVYQAALLIELRLAGLAAEAGTRIPVYYRGELVGDFIADILVGKAIILELKAVQDIHPAHESQLVNYLQATGLEVGLLLNFGSTCLQIKRKHRTYKSSPVAPENPVLLSKKTAFTILELLVAMAVMSLLLVLLMNMVDSATKLWRVNENRVDSYREARAALGIMARDLQNLVPTTNTSYFLFNADAFPKLSSAGTALTNTISASAAFFLAALPAAAQDSASNKSDVCQVGYFLAFDRTTVATNKSLNLYRYFRSSDPTFQALTAPSGLYQTPPPQPATDDTELLARNVTSLSLRAFTFTNSSLAPFSSSVATPVPDLVEISVSAINQDTAKRLDNNVASWTNTNSPIIKPTLQTFTTRIQLNRPQ